MASRYLGSAPWRMIGGMSCTTAAVEVGGGPWDSAWRAEATMKEPLRSLVQLPVDVEAVSFVLPGTLRPPGL